MVTLWSYFRSTAAYRVRIALNAKNISYKQIYIHLAKNEQFSSDYLSVNPQARIPFLDDEGVRIGQSFAILEYLEEKYPLPPLLPGNAEDRAWARNFAQIIVADIHPLNNSSVLNYLKKGFSANEDEINNWYFNWLKQGFDALEKMLSSSKNYQGKYCYKDQLTFADICLIPQIFNAHRFNFDMADYPYLSAIEAYGLTHPAVQAAHPSQQEDAC